MGGEVGRYQRVLVRQLERHFGTSDPREWCVPSYVSRMEGFLLAISATYAQLESQVERLHRAHNLAAQDAINRIQSLELYTLILSDTLRGYSTHRVMERVNRLLSGQIPDIALVYVRRKNGRFQHWPTRFERVASYTDGTETSQSSETCQITIVGKEQAGSSLHRALEKRVRRIASALNAKYCCIAPLSLWNEGDASWLLAFTERRPLTSECASCLQKIAVALKMSVAHYRVEAERRRLIKRLEAALARARAAVDAKSRFLATMSHEIRTPMNGVLGMAQLLLDSGLTKQQAEDVKTLKTSAEHMLVILNDILDLAKLEAGRFTLRNEPLELRAVVQEVVELFKANAVQKRIRLESKVVSGVPQYVWGDAVRLRQVLANLVGNAIKFTDAGRVTIRVSSHTASAEAPSRSCTLRFTVIDTGVGISPESVERIFEPFEQAHDTFGGNGTGLGLSICKRLVEAMGGCIGVESKPGKGSSFWFEVCLPSAEAVELDKKATLRDETLPLPKGARVLVVEDNEVNLMVAVRMLERLGCSAETAKNGFEAVQKCLAATYDVVFMDCQMPELDGYQAARRIRELESKTGRHVPIIAVTAHASASERERCLQSGMDDFLSKPIVCGELQAMLRKWIGVAFVSATRRAS